MEADGETLEKSWIQRDGRGTAKIGNERWKRPKGVGWVGALAGGGSLEQPLEEERGGGRKVGDAS